MQNTDTIGLMRPSEWVAKYGDYLYRYALSRLRDGALAEDAVQETFLSALKAQHTYRGESTEKTWLVGILKHKIIDTFRKRAREIPESEVTLPFEQEGLFYEAHEDWAGHWKVETRPANWSNANWKNTPLAAAEESDFQRVFQFCFGKLPERVGLAFAMKEIDDLESKEICATLDITEANLWVMLHRARMHLRRCLELRWFAAEGQ